LPVFLTPLTVFGMWLHSPKPLQAASPTVKFCLARNLNASLLLLGAAGSREGDITLRNKGAKPCRLQGRPALKIRNADNRTLALQYKPSGGRGTALIVNPKDTAVVSFLWHNWCGKAVESPLHVKLSIGHKGGSLNAAWAPSGMKGVVSPPCLAGKKHASVVDVGVFKPHM
jgi:hypothetical protein